MINREMEAFRSYSAAFLLLLTAMLVMVQGKDHYYEFVLSEKNYTRVCETKSMLVVNEQLPGPTIRAQKGDTVYVNVINNGTYGLTVHWHGVKQPRNPWHDGVVYITQCPIQPGTNFTYQVYLSEEEGTVWWHAHSNWTRNSVHGAISVYPAEGTTFPFPTPDGEEILMIGDWYAEDENEMIEEEGAEGGFSSILPSVLTINSEPGDFHECSKENTYRWEVEYGKTYLLRLINVAMDEFVYLSISGHNLTVVGTDGAYLKPFVTDFVAIGPGETLDVLLTANQSIGQYYIASYNYFTTTARLNRFPTLNGTAILQYKGSESSETPLYPDGSIPYYTNIMAGIDFVSKFRSLANEEYPVDVPKNITTSMYVTTALNYNTRDSFPYIAASMNNLSWVDPATSVLDAYYMNLTGYYTADFLDEPPVYFDFLEDYMGDNVSQSTMATRVKMLEYNEEVEIVFQSTNVYNSSTNHPMHLHGYSFYVVGIGLGIYDKIEDPKTFNLVDPPYQNTAVVPKLGWAAIRFKASNPGVWFLHCHIEHHYTYGMQTAFLVKNGGTSETNLLPRPSNMPKCSSSSSQVREIFQKPGSSINFFES